MMEMPMNANQSLYTSSANAWLKSINQDKWLAGGITVLFHLSMGALLLAGWVASKPAEPVVRSIKVQMISLNTPALAPAPQVVAEVAPALPAEPVVTMPQKTVKPQPQKADVAFKRVEEKPIVEETPVNNQLNVERELQEKRQQETALNQQREAEESRLKAAQAAAAKQAEATQLANNQYLPVEKNAPAYPERALDKGLEGACTVSYTVNTQGRVETPQALGDCHPLFIKPSLEAAKSFKYVPRVVDGKAVNVSNVKNTFQYRIQ
jgi:outer membrane biosynthesis protein TonB